MTSATYLYAVCHTVDPLVLRQLPGVCPGEPVRSLAVGELTAVVQRMPEGDLTEDAWRRRMGEAREVERCALAHHEVVSAVAVAGPVAPLALATLYSGDERVTEAVEREADRFRSVLDRVSGHAEWGVKVYATPADRTPRTPAGRSAPLRDGRAYLEHRRAQYRDRDRRWEDAVQVADGVERELRDVAAAVRRLRVHGPAVREPGPQLLNAACLVARGREPDLMTAVERARRRLGSRIEVTGPWVPYSFAGIGEDGS